MDQTPLAFVDEWTTELRALSSAVEAKSTSSESASDSVQRLSQRLTERSGDLPTSELARCERELKSLQDTLATLKSQAAPKAKFSFKRPAKPSASSSQPAAVFPPTTSAVLPPLSPSIQSTAPRTHPSVVPPNALTISSRIEAYLSTSDLPNPSSTALQTGASVALTSLTRCFVDLLSTDLPDLLPSPPLFSAIYLSELEGCVVLFPPTTSGSILIQSCRDCVFVLGVHQFRMHDSSDCRVFLQAGSNPVIERCKGLVFGTYPSSLSPSSDACILPPKPPQDFDDPFASPERPSLNWRFATGEEEEALFEGDKTGKSKEGRREGWKAMVDRWARRQG